MRLDAPIHFKLVHNQFELDPEIIAFYLSDCAGPKRMALAGYGRSLGQQPSLLATL